ncbi:MAG: DNA repair protein RecO [Verrucomicrobiaceae bacterium]
MERARGTIIRLTRLTETSLIVHWLTEDAGLIKTVAKGARRAKSSFAGRIDLFIEGELEWTRSSRSELHGLREVHVVDYRAALRRSYRDSVVAAYFGQLLEMVLELDHPVPEMFDLLQRGLGYLVEKGADRRGFLHFEAEVARLLGLGDTSQSAILRAYGRLPTSRDHCLDLLS